jgi:hypothetical protein
MSGSSRGGHADAAAPAAKASRGSGGASVTGASPPALPPAGDPAAGVPDWALVRAGPSAGPPLPPPPPPAAPRYGAKPHPGHLPIRHYPVGVCACGLLAFV